jgi:hypothetical protein
MVVSPAALRHLRVRTGCKAPNVIQQVERGADDATTVIVCAVPPSRDAHR